MGALSRMMLEATLLRVEQWRPCPDCRGRGEHHAALRAPDGSTPVRKVVARVQCSTCKGACRVLVGEEWREGTRVHEVRDYSRGR